MADAESATTASGRSSLNDPDDSGCVEETCDGCEDSYEQHSCDYVNAECPSGCSTEHDTETRYRYDPVVCPETGDRWVDCHECGWTEVGRYDSPCSGPGGYMYCPSCANDIYTCDNCGVGMWHDDVQSTDDSYYCNDCYSEQGEAGDFRGEAEELHRCGNCDTFDLHMDLLTEEFLCDHLAVERHAKNQPVFFHHPVETTVAADGEANGSVEVKADKKEMVAA